MANIPARLAFVVAGLAASCGGKASETAIDGGGSANAGRAGLASSCAEQQDAADEALRALIDANNGCEVDADCTSAIGFGACYTYCIVPVRRSKLDAVTQSGQDLCRSYGEHPCAIEFACPNSPGVGCNHGRCGFKF